MTSETLVNIDQSTQRNNPEDRNLQNFFPQVFRLKHSGEEKRYRRFKKLHNRKLLWHGSRLTNFAGILSQVKGVNSIGLVADHCTAVVGFDIYIIGGQGPSCRCFNAVTKTGRMLAPMHESRWYLSVAVLRGAVYAMGGFYGGLCLSTAERYDCETDQWSLIAPMNTKRTFASAAVLNDKVYIAGGGDGNNCLNSVEVYDPDTNRWTFVAPMFSGRKHCSCIEFLGCLYAIGGHNETSSDLSTEKYDPAEDKWTEIPGMVIHSYCSKVEVIDDKIFVINGRYNQGSACDDDKEIRWYQAAERKFYRSRMSTCVVKNLPNASDYAYKRRDKLMKEKRKK